MQENENAARPRVRARTRLEVSQSSYGGHEPIVDVLAARVELEWGRRRLRPPDQESESRQISDVRTLPAPRARDSDRARIGCSRRPTRRPDASQDRWRRR